jgi:hypothetical protein
MKNDVYGEGLIAYQNEDKNAFFIVESDIAETESWEIEVFFRPFNKMPELEKIALKRVEGGILDIGAGAGSHSLWLQDQGKDVTALDISPGAVQVMKQRGIKQVICEDFFKYEGKRYDTLLLLMNGIGIAGSLKDLSFFFEKARSVLNKNGKIILDSSDLIYLFEEEDGSFMIDLNGKYYGELQYSFQFQGSKGEPFNWLFIDFDTLSDYAELCGFKARKIYEDSHYQYLAELVLK